MAKVVTTEELKKKIDGGEKFYLLDTLLKARRLKQISEQ